MYVIRDGPVHRHASQLRRGNLPRPVFICCGSVGVVLTVIGGVVLGVGQKSREKDDYTLILVGSITLGFGFILTVLAVFLSISWATLTAPDYEERLPHRSSRSSSAVTREVPDLDELELNGCRGSRDTL